MNELQLRFELQKAVQNYVEQLFSQGVPAHIIEDAFTKALGCIKDKSFQEFLVSITNPPTEDEKRENGSEQSS